MKRGCLAFGCGVYDITDTGEFQSVGRHLTASCVSLPSDVRATCTDALREQLSLRPRHDLGRFKIP